MNLECISDLPASLATYTISLPFLKRMETIQHSYRSYSQFMIINNLYKLAIVILRLVLGTAVCRLLSAILVFLDSL